MSQKILITGSTGFIGRNLIESLTKLNQYEILTTNSKTTKEDLIEKTKQADFIVHLGGVTRTTDPGNFFKGNSELTNTITSTLLKENKKIPIILTSSVHAPLENEYGESKRLSEKSISDYGKQQEAPVYIFRLTNTFGKWAKPNHHSVIANFCYNIANKLEISISDPKKELNLFYIDDVVITIISIIEKKECSLLAKNGEFYTINKMYTKTLQELADTIKGFEKNSTIKDDDDEFNSRLLKTFLSYKP